MKRTTVTLLATKVPVKAPLLTSNDIAVCQNGLGHMLNFLKTLERGKFKRDQIKATVALQEKLERAVAHLNPYYPIAVGMPLDWGDDPIYGPLTKRQQKLSIES